MDQETYGGIMIVPLIIGCSELAKTLGLPKKFAGLFSVLLGILIAIFYLEPNNFKLALLKGLAIGLSASGLYSTSKNTAQEIKKRNSPNE